MRKHTRRSTTNAAFAFRARYTGYFRSQIQITLFCGKSGLNDPYSYNRFRKGTWHLIFVCDQLLSFVLGHLTYISIVQQVNERMQIADDGDSV